MLQAGDLLLVYCTYINPPGYKYALCVYPQFPLFFFINSKPRTSKPDAQIMVKKDELPFLKLDSYINTGMVFTFSDRELSNAKHLGTLPDSIKEQIKDTVSNHEYLVKKYSEIIFQNFS